MAKHSLSLIDIERAFGTEEKCIAYLESFRWPEGVRCLKCDSDKVSRFKTNETVRERKNRKGEIKEVRVPARHLYQCNGEGCRHQFSPTANTIFADSHLPLTTWFKAIGLLMNAKKGISAKQMERDLGCHYRTAWHLNHRIREAMASTEGLFGGVVEVDATFVGGAYDPRRKRGAYDKQPVAGVIQRKTEDSHSKVKAFPVPKEIAKVMTGVIRDNVAIDAEVMTDEHGAYMKLTKAGWKHEIVSHSKEEWVRGNVHTQGIENFWSLFKRGVIGSFHSVSVKHLHRYLNEFSFRFNNRESDAIFAMVVMNLVIGTALRYKTLTAPVSVGKYLPQIQAARVETLSDPPHQTKETGIGIFLLNGGVFTLDNFHLRHVILTNVEVHYSGAPAFLEDVTFVNCRFVMDNAPATRELASNILQSDRINFSLS